jgi:hypothetical protein
LRGVGHREVPDEAEPFECTNHPPGDVDLAAVESVTRRGGKRVVVVVPALAEDEQRDEAVVARLIA